MLMLYLTCPIIQLPCFQLFCPQLWRCCTLRPQPCCCWLLLPCQFCCWWLVCCFQICCCLSITNWALDTALAIIHAIPHPSSLASDLCCATMHAPWCDYRCASSCLMLGMWLLPLVFWQCVPGWSMSYPHVNQYRRLSNLLITLVWVLSLPPPLPPRPLPPRPPPWL